MNDTNNLKDFFIKYINETDYNKKMEIFEKGKSEYPNQVFIINRIVKIIQELETKESKLSFINNVFNVEKGLIEIELIDNIESQLENRTFSFQKITGENVNVVSYDNFEKSERLVAFTSMTNNFAVINNSKKIVTSINEQDTRIYNNIVERLLGITTEKLSIAYKDDKTFLLSSKELPEIKKTQLIKEESLCDPREIQYLFDKMIDNKMTKRIFLERVLVDLITNQNYRDFDEDLGCINSDLIENDYYVINGATIKKDYAFESLYRNYREDINRITNLIVDNYNIILNFIDDLLKAKRDINSTYLENLKINIVKVYEKSKIEMKLYAIENGTEVDIFDDNRNNRNEKFKTNLDNLKKSLNLDEYKLTKAGYTNIIILVFVIIVFGISVAYLMFSR